MKRAALVDADLRAARGIEHLLIEQGFRVFLFATLGRFLDSLLRASFDALLMDLHMPGMEGREMLRALRGSPKTRRLPIIALSGKPRAEEDVAAVFDAGADEFFFKPPDPRLLVARLHSLLSREALAAPETSLRCAGIAVYPESRVCRIDDEERRLTRLEFDILLQFMRNPRRVLTRGYLIHALWRGDGSRGARAVDRHIHSLRTKMGAYGGLLETLVGIGYRLREAEAKTRRA